MQPPKPPKIIKPQSQRLWPHEILMMMSTSLNAVTTPLNESFTLWPMMVMHPEIQMSQEEALLTTTTWTSMIPSLAPILKMMMKSTATRSSLRTLWSSSLRLSRALLAQVVIQPPTPLLAPRSKSPTRLTGQIPANSRFSLSSVSYINFQDHPRAFSMDCAKVMFTQSYLKGMALEWFKSDLLQMENSVLCAAWMVNFHKFILELQTNFGSHDPVVGNWHSNV